MKPGGFLFLGSSESAEASKGYFQPINRDTRIYQASPATADTQRLPPRLALSPRPFALSRTWDSAPNDRGKSLNAASPCARGNGAAKHSCRSGISGHSYIGNSRPISSTLRRAADSRRDRARPARTTIRLRAGLHNTFEKNSSELSLPIPLSVHGTRKRMYIQVWPIRSGGERPEQALILFIEGATITPADKEPSSSPEEKRTYTDRLMSMQEELELTRARLRTSREESEGANEEPRAANEELQSINEEYRSTAEELETRKEELQSINEELQTVNNEPRTNLKPFPAPKTICKTSWRPRMRHAVFGHKSRIDRTTRLSLRSST